MFVDLMHDVHHTFAEKFLRVQVVFNADAPPGAPVRPPVAPQPPKKRYNALGVEEPADDGVSPVVDSGPDEDARPVTRREPIVIGAGRGVRSLAAGGGAAVPADWSNVGRNDPCPCGSGKKYKKCHGSRG